MRAVKKYGVFALPGIVFLALAVLNLFYQDNWLDSDMAAEMIFSRLLAKEGRLIATPNWYYSTEFRVLYTQLIMTPLFYITDNWHLIRMVTNLLSYVLMLASYFYMLKSLQTDKRLAAVTGTILLIPFSETMITHMQMGNTYMFHVILLLFYFGMFLRLAEGKEYGIGRKWALRIVYAVLSVVFGLSGVRYLLAMQCPLVIAAVLYVLGSEEFKQFRTYFGVKSDAGRYWKVAWQKRGRYVSWSFFGAAGGMFGYCLNVAWVSRAFVFQTYGTTNFIAVYQGILWERLQNAFGSLIMLFGYIPNKSFLSLRGCVTLAAFVLIAVFGCCVGKAYRQSVGCRFFAILFFIVAFAVNLFVFVFTTSTMVPRYYITLLIFALPALAFYLEDRAGKTPLLDRLAVILLLMVCLGLGSFKIVFSYLTTDKNADRRAVAAFLAENDYNFGYATYWNANITTELTNGLVEAANINNPEELQYFKWSSPMKYYEEDYRDGEVFLLLTNEEAAEYETAKALQRGEKIYQDDHYIVFVYKNKAALMDCARKE